jgi:hypothetical protein
MLNFWLSSYKSTAIEVLIPTLKDSKPTNTFQQWQQKKEKRVDIDEYQRYILSPVLQAVTDPRAWWLEPTQRKTYPALSIMALDILSIPAMSAEPERLFSGAKITITDRRNKLGIASIQAIECLKSWMSTTSTPYVDENTSS